MQKQSLKGQIKCSLKKHDLNEVCDKIRKYHENPKNSYIQKIPVIILKFEQCGITTEYRKNPKISDTWKFAVITLKVEQGGFSLA